LTSDKNGDFTQTTVAAKDIETYLEQLEKEDKEESDKKAKK